MSPLRAEIDKLARLAAPVVVANLGTMLMGAVDTAMVGRVGVDALAAVSIGNVWVHGTFLFIQGVLFGMDPIVARAHGAGDGRGCGLALRGGWGAGGHLVGTRARAGGGGDAAGGPAARSGSRTARDEAFLRLTDSAAESAFSIPKLLVCERQRAGSDDFSPSHCGGCNLCYLQDSFVVRKTRLPAAFVFWALRCMFGADFARGSRGRTGRQ